MAIRRGVIRWIRNAAVPELEGQLPKNYFPLDGDSRVSDDSLEPPVSPMRLDQIRPDFSATALGHLLHQFGIEGGQFERFTEQNPRAFHSTYGEARQWLNFVQGVLPLSTSELASLFCQMPKLLFRPVDQITSVVEKIKDLLYIEDPTDMRAVIKNNPSVFRPGFESRFDRAMTVLYERFKISPEEVKTLCKSSHNLLGFLDESDLMRLASLMDKTISLSPVQLGMMIKNCPAILYRTIYGMQDRLTLLRNVYLTPDEIRSMAIECPAILGSRSPSDLRHVVDYIEVRLNTSTTVVARMIKREPKILTLSSEKDIEPSLAALKNFGFSQYEMLLMSVRCPQILTLQLYGREIREKVDFLQNKLDKAMDSLLTYPQYLTYSLEGHIKPRVNFILSLDRSDYKEWPLMKLFGDSDEQFCIRHVRTKPETYFRFKERLQL